MNFARRLGLTCAGAILATAIAAGYVALSQMLTGRGMHPVEALLVFAALLLAYAGVALFAALLGNFLWLAVRLFAGRLEAILLPGLVSVIYFSLLADALRSTDFFAPGGKWVPALLLFGSLSALFFMNSRKPLHV